MKHLVSAIVLSLAFVSPAKSESPERLASSGSWTLYRGTYNFVMKDGLLGIKHSCFASTGSKNATLSFAALPEEVTKQNKELLGVIYLQAAAGVWNFRKRSAKMTIGNGSLDMVIVGTYYDGNHIMVNMGGNGHAPIEFSQAAELWSGPITIKDPSGKTLATFQSKGLKRIYSKLLDCAGTR